MSRWFRFYTSVLDDPKAQMLSPELFKHWVNVLCIAAQHDGELPSLPVTSFMLGRMPEPKAAGVLAKLHSHGLLDKTEKSFKPHNWDSRQYKHDKTDNTNAERQKRFRNGRRNADSNADSNGVTPVTTKRTREQITEADSSEANASGADAPRDFRAELFQSGLAKLAAMTGKGPDSCRSFVGKCLKAAGDDAVTVLGLIEDAERNRVADPSAWIAARLKSTGPPSALTARPLTEFQRKQAETNDVRNLLNGIASGGEGGGTAAGFLSRDHGQRSEAIRDGTRAGVRELSGTPGRDGG